MAIKRKKRSSAGGSWLDTYADMVTLLLTFFVMLFSMSTVDAQKWEQLVQAFKNPGTETNQIILTPDVGAGEDVGTNTGAAPEGDGKNVDSTDEIDFDTLYEYLQEYVETNGLEATIEVNEGEESVFIRFSDVIAFDADSYQLRPESYKVLGFLGDALKQVEDELLSVIIAGHTANVEGPYRVSDIRLSTERAASVAIYLRDEKKITAKKVQALGHGANYPVASNGTPEGREKNRRVELMILSDKVDLANKEVLEYFLKGTFDADVYPASGGAQDVVIPNTTSQIE